MPSIARDQRQNDDRPAQVVGRTQRPRPQPQQRRGTDLQGNYAVSVMRVATPDTGQEILNVQVVLSM